MQLVTKSFANQCLAFPEKVDAALAEIETVEQAKDMLDQAATMRHYAERLKAGVEIERPIALGVLKIKAKLGEMMPAKPPADRGQGRNGSDKSTSPSEVDLEFAPATASAYRKLAANKDKLEEYYEETDDVPTQGEFLRFAKGGSQVLKNSKNDEWYTPAVYIDAARDVMGSIDVDPCSCETAQKQVQAKTFYTKSDNGLDYEWKGNVWMNPPYSKEVIGEFTSALIDEHSAGRVSQAIVLVNNATETGWLQPLLETADAVCFPKGRIKFLDEGGDVANSPVQGQVFLYLGANVDVFCDRFESFGVCLVRRSF